MPMYEYQCQKCGHVIEELQRFDDPPLTECRECGGDLKKLVSAPAFQFKGSGWYVTDYAGKGKRGGSSSGDSSGGEGSSGGDKKESSKSSGSSESSGSKSSSKASSD